jgi:hypothetical protein
MPTPSRRRNSPLRVPLCRCVRHISVAARRFYLHFVRRYPCSLSSPRRYPVHVLAIINMCPRCLQTDSPRDNPTSTCFYSAPGTSSTPVVLLHVSPLPFRCLIAPVCVSCRHSISITNASPGPLTHILCGRTVTSHTLVYYCVLTSIKQILATRSTDRRYTCVLFASSVTAIAAKEDKVKASFCKNCAEHNTHKNLFLHIV